MAPLTASSTAKRATVPISLWLSLFIFGTVIALGLMGLDSALAKAITRSRALNPLVDFLELVTLKIVSEFILPALLLIGSGTLWVAGRSRLARALCYWASCR
jgi:hypothetical protein